MANSDFSTRATDQCCKSHEISRREPEPIRAAVGAHRDPYCSARNNERTPALACLNRAGPNALFELPKNSLDEPLGKPISHFAAKAVAKPHFIHMFTLLVKRRMGILGSFFPPPARSLPGVYSSRQLPAAPNLGRFFDVLLPRRLARTARR